MTPAGWIFMIVSWTAILGIFTYCLSRTLRSSERDDKQMPEK